jgi:hypothetical protein
LVVVVLVEVELVLGRLIQVAEVLVDIDFLMELLQVVIQRVQLL